MVGCAVANIFQSIGEAPSAIGPITSISFTQDDALVSFTVVQREISFFFFNDPSMMAIH